ncbi:hypothetical protein GEMRC1_002841 [Eukaryota sp. GEM-RC1]
MSTDSAPLLQKSTSKQTKRKSKKAIPLKASSVYAPSVVSGSHINQSCLKEEDFPIAVTSLRLSYTKFSLFILLSIITLGVLPLLCHWFVRMKSLLQYSYATPETASHVLILDYEDKYHLLPVSTTPSDVPFFCFRYVRFVLAPVSIRSQLSFTCHLDNWTPIEFIPAIPSSVIVDRYSAGITSSSLPLFSSLFGLNELDIPIGSFFKLLITESLNPFYIFQAASVILWWFSDYQVYATCILVISLFSVSLSVIEVRRNRRKLSEMARFSSDVTVLRGETYSTIDSSLLLPGDIISIPTTSTSLIPCDCVLLSGSCLVNEAAMTGESNPVPKSSLTPSSAVFAPGTDRRHTLFCGSTVVRAKPVHHDAKVKALVMRTGFYSAKGCLVRNILFPRSTGLQFYADSLKFIGVFSIFALGGAAYSVYIAYTNNFPPI